MNYGYNQNTRQWDETKKDDLAVMLGRLCAAGDYEDKYGMRPYVEIDGLYPGVRIRRITHLTAEQESSLITEADKIYDSVMGVVV